MNIGQEIIIPSDETREALKRLWNIGIFSDAKIYIDKKFGNDVYLVIEVEELPRVEKVEITGNDEYDDEDLKDYVNLVTGEVVSDQKLQDIKFNLEKYYAEDQVSIEELKSKQMAEGTLQWFPIPILKYGELRRRRDTSLKSENIGNKIPKVTQFILDVIEASEKNREKAGLPADQRRLRGGGGPPRAGRPHRGGSRRCPQPAAAGGGGR